jgi:hypothetical protein
VPAGGITEDEEFSQRMMATSNRPGRRFLMAARAALIIAACAMAAFASPGIGRAGYVGPSDQQTPRPTARPTVRAEPAAKQTPRPAARPERLTNRAQTVEVCPLPFVPVTTPLMDGEGLYPGGSNARPPAHAADGLVAAARIVPRDASGAPHPDGKIVLLSIGMSNTMIEYREFERNVAPQQPGINPSLEIISGAVAGQPVNKWLDPNAPVWQVVNDRLAHRRVTPEQVGAVWLKHAYIGVLPWQSLQADLETVIGNLRDKFPNLQIVYVSSRTRSYSLESRGTSPEPTAFETGYAVKGLTTKYINGEMPSRPYVTWGPYLWADGENPRSDGLTWLAADMERDCVHPSDSGARKVANLLLAHFTTDSTAAPWFMADGKPLPVTPSPTRPTVTPATPTQTATPTATATRTAAATATATRTTSPERTPTSTKLLLPAIRGG